MADKEIWSKEAKAVMETVGLSKPLEKPAEKAPEAKPECPFCEVAPDGKASTGAKQICSTASDQSECHDVLVTLAEVPDKKTYGFAEQRLKEVAGDNETTQKFISAARRIWWNEKP